MMAVNIVGMFLVGPTPALVWSMYADVADYGEWKFGRRTTGLVFSAAQFAQKFGLTIGGGLSGWLLGAFGFVANMDQTESSLLGIRLMFTVIPACLAAMNALVLVFYNLSDGKVVQIETELERRRQQDAGAQPSPVAE
jgi:GPH family glycoside/pentoside/hexuronide:cation symporter